MIIQFDPIWSKLCASSSTAVFLGFRAAQTLGRRPQCKNLQTSDLSPRRRFTRIKSFKPLHCVGAWVVLQPWQFPKPFCGVLFHQSLVPMGLWRSYVPRSWVLGETSNGQSEGVARSTHRSRWELSVKCKMPRASTWRWFTWIFCQIENCPNLWSSRFLLKKAGMSQRSLWMLTIQAARSGWCGGDEDGESEDDDCNKSQLQWSGGAPPLENSRGWY